MIGPVFISTFWQGTVPGALAAIIVGFLTSGTLMLASDLGWVEGPLIGCLASSVCYFVESMATRGSAQALARRA